MDNVKPKGKTLPKIEELQTELAELRAVRPPQGRQHPAFERMLQRMYAEVEEIREILTPQVQVDVAPSVIPPAEVRVMVEDQSAAILALTKTMGDLIKVVAEKDFQVNVSAVPVTVEMMMPEHEPRERVVVFERDAQGRMSGATITES